MPSKKPAPQTELDLHGINAAAMVRFEKRHLRDPGTAAERTASEVVVENIHANIEKQSGTKKAIREAIIADFTEELDARLRSLRYGEALQATYRVDILKDGHVRPKKASEERSSEELAAWRLAVMVRDKFTCQHPRCNVRSGDIQAHHIKPWAKFPKLRFDITNGITLCRIHHADQHPECRKLILCGKRNRKRKR